MGGYDYSDTPGDGCNKVGCGGCAVPWYLVRCSWGNVDLPDFDRDFDDAWQACAAAQQAFAAAGAGGVGIGGFGSLGGAPGAAGAASARGGACATYVDPPAEIYGCDICEESYDEDLAGTCTIDDECCVVVIVHDCGV